MEVPHERGGAAEPSRIRGKDRHRVVTADDLWGPGSGWGGGPSEGGGDWGDGGDGGDGEDGDGGGDGGGD